MITGGINIVKKTEIRKTDERKDNHEENKDIFNIWIDSYNVVSRMWEDSYFRIYNPWFESTGEVFRKAVELSKNAAPEEYKEFYTIWLNTYQETCGKLFDFQFMSFSNEVFENFVRTADVNLNLTMSWIATLEKLSQKAEELSKQNADAETRKELYNLWGKTYEKVFDNFFENTPTISPFKEILEPVKNVTKIYADTFSNMSNIRVNPYNTSKDTI
jgi:hypothetical protein